MDTWTHTQLQSCPESCRDLLDRLLIATNRLAYAGEHALPRDVERYQASLTALLATLKRLDACEAACRAIMRHATWDGAPQADLIERGIFELIEAALKI